MSRSDTGAWPVIFLVGLIAYGTVSSTSMLKSFRHAPEQPSASSATATVVSARLWQDPLAAAVQATRKTGEPSVIDIDTLRQNDVLPAQVAFCLDITQGGDAPENTERRLRNRYAVVSALGRLGYFPDDPDQLHVLPEIQLDPRKPAPDAGTPTAGTADTQPPTPRWANASRPIPFESFSLDPGVAAAMPTAPSITRVIVLWLSDRDFGGLHIAQRLDNACCFVRATLFDADFSARPLDYRPRIFIIGPTNSDDYIKLINGLKPDAGEGPLTCLRNSSIVSPFATIDDASLSRPERMSRSIIHDGELVKALVEELALRDAIARTPPKEDDASACPPSKEDDAIAGTPPKEAKPPTPHPAKRVVLVAELDTPYARSLVSACRDEILRTHNQTSVVAYDYLRGLDGLSGSSASDRLPVAAPEKKGLFSTPAYDRPAGSAQFDYLRRLAFQIKLDAQADAITIGDIRAIGIFGTDVYDKLLILQALRSEFPGVVFFTTDLDQRLLLPDQNQWARNLVVASSFGLQLGQSLQGNAAPFRDSYQTAVYWATLLGLAGIDDAMHGALHEALAHQPAAAAGARPKRRTTHVPGASFDLPFHPDRPHVYEVGRTELFDLTGNSGGSPFFPAAPRVDWTAGVKKPFNIGIAAFLLLGFLVFAYFNGSRRAVGRTPCGLKDWWCSLRAGARRPATWPRAGRVLFARRSPDLVRFIRGVIVAVALIAAFILIADAAIDVTPPAAGGEPFALFEGISVWPTQIIRFAVLCLAVAWFSFLLLRWKENASSIEERYHIRIRRGPLAPALFPFSSFLTSLRKITSPLQIVIQKRSLASVQKAFALAWRQSLVRSIVRVTRIVVRHPSWRAVRRTCSAIWHRSMFQDFFRHAPVVGWHYRRRPVNARVLWSQYTTRAHAFFQPPRVLILTLFYFIFCLLVFQGFAIPPRPTRGIWATRLDLLIVILSTTCSAALTLLVWDATRLCDRFTRFLVSPLRTSYPRTARQFALQTRGLDDELAPSWLDIRIIAERTDSIIGAIYYPIATLFMLLVARNRVFDDWHWSTPVFLALGANAGVMLYAGWILRRSAERARVTELARLRSLLSQAQQQDRSKRVDLIEGLIKEITDIHEGAFSPWNENPLLKSLLIPFGGAGIIGVIDVLAKYMQ